MDVLTEYRADLESCNHLPKKETVRLKSLADQGDLSARNALAESVLRLAWSIASEYVGISSLSFSDLVGEANLHVLKAVDTWEPERGALTTHTEWVLRHGLVHSLRTQGHNGIYLPNSARVAATDPNSKARHAGKARAAYYMWSVDTLQKDDHPDVLAEIHREENSTICLADIKWYLKARLRGSENATARSICRRYFGLREKPPQPLGKIGEALGMKGHEVKKILDATCDLMRQDFEKKSGCCEWCNGLFTRDQIESTRFCSRECARKSYNARRREAPSDRRTYYYCQKCSKPIFKSKRLRYCSDVCAKTVELENTRAKARAKAESIPEQPCKVCNKPFTPDTVRKRLYCSEYCSNRRHRNPTRTIPCKGCNKPVTTSSSRRHYCSVACRKAREVILKRENRRRAG